MISQHQPWRNGTVTWNRTWPDASARRRSRVVRQHRSLLLIAAARSAFSVSTQLSGDQQEAECNEVAAGTRWIFIGMRGFNSCSYQGSCLEATDLYPTPLRVVSFLPHPTQDHTSEQEDELMVVKSMGMALAWHKLPGQKRMLELKPRRAFF